MSEIASLATTLEIPQLTVIERIYDNLIPDIKPSIKRKIAPFIKVIRTLRKLDEEVRKLWALSFPTNNFDYRYRAEHASIRDDSQALDYD
jgi:hypothetical protein